VTRDRGAHVLFAGTVPAGLTAMQALDRKLDVETRYGGRFVQAIDGLEGDAGRRRDWFFFVNGVEGRRSAVEYRLRDGDVEWWDYRSWKGAAITVPVVVGAFPEPFLHGHDGERRGVTVVAERRADAAAARRLARTVRGTATVRPNGAPPADRRNTIVIDPSLPPGTARAELRGDRVRLLLGVAAARRLAADPAAARMRYEGLRP
jgi:hypothetical protein